MMIKQQKYNKCDERLSPFSNELSSDSFEAISDAFRKEDSKGVEPSILEASKSIDIKKKQINRVQTNSDYYVSLWFLFYSQLIHSNSGVNHMN